MPRSYARITTSIWRDGDFIALEPQQQALYFLLVTQPEISGAGTLPLTTRRWATSSPAWTRDAIEAEIHALEDHGHVVVDEDTEELLVRTFIKWDGGWNNSKRIPVIRDAACAISSPALRGVVAEELEKLGLSDVASLLRADRASAGVSPSERVGVTKVLSITNPQSATLEREPFDASAEPPSMFCPAHPQGTTEKCGPCGTARLQFNAWHDADAQRVQREKNEAKARLRSCRRCNDVGFIEAPDGSPVEKCNHLGSVAS